MQWMAATILICFLKKTLIEKQFVPKKPEPYYLIETNQG